MGLPYENTILCDTKGVIYQGREEGMNQWKSAHAANTSLRTLEEAMDGADAVFGLSVKGAFTAEMIKSMANNPIVFAMANPDPEITPEEVAEIRPDAIMATGRSDYPNQINNVLGFPYIFRGALDVRASTINDEMKIAAARALADLAREEVPDEVTSVYRGRHLRFGKDYLIPTPFDPRLITHVPPAVAHAAERSGVAQKPIASKAAYIDKLRSRQDPTASRMQQIIDRVRSNPKRMVFAEGEEETSIRAAIAWQSNGLGTPILIGREEAITSVMDSMGVEIPDNLEIHNARRTSDRQCSLRRAALSPKSAKRHVVSRLPAPSQSGPQHFQCLHGGKRRCRCHGHRPHPKHHLGAGRHPKGHRSKAWRTGFWIDGNGRERAYRFDFGQPDP